MEQGPLPRRLAVFSSSRQMWRRLLPIAGLLLLAVIIARLDRGALLEAATGLPPATLLGAAACFAGGLLFKSFRWHRMLIRQGNPLPLPLAVSTYFAGVLYGLVTIGRVGEIARAEPLVARGTPLGRAVSSVVAERMVDVSILALLGAGSLCVWIADESWSWILLVLFGLVATSTFVLWRRLLTVFSRWTSRAGFGGTGWFGSRVGRLGKSFVEGMIDVFRPVSFVEIVSWSVPAWSLYLSTIWLLAAGFGIDVAFSTLVAATCLAALMTLLPITYQGLGAREVAFSLVLGLAGVTPEAAIALSLVHFGSMFFVSSTHGLMGVLVCRLIRRNEGRATAPADSPDARLA